MGTPYIMRKGVSVLGDLKDGAYNKNVILQGAKTVFHVDGNAGNDGQDGFGWPTAFKTLTFALAASQADISSGAPGWAARNVILAKADAFDEDLVLLAQKTDVIGLGHWDQFQGAGLIGNHIPTGTANSAFGTRFFNFYFRANPGGGDIWTLDSTVASLGFYGCTFDSQSTTPATAAIVTVASPFLQIWDNEFRGKFSDSTIEIGTGSARGLRIVGNYVEGETDGIELLSGVTDEVSGAPNSEQYMLIKDNVVISVDIGVNDASGLAYVIDNRVVTENAKGAAGAGAIVAGAKRMLGNKISASDVANADVPALGAL